MRPLSLGQRVQDSKVSSKTFIPVFGMHRSGTSCLSGIVQEMGVYYHNASKWNRFNLKGNQENESIVAFHDEILRLNGGSWTCLDADGASLSLDLSLFDFDTAKNHLNQVQTESEVFGFKDPRTVLFWDCWRSLCDSLKIDFVPIGIYRDPRAVAASINSRDKFSIERGFEIWMCYNRRLLDAWSNLGFPLLCFSAFPEVFKFEVRLARQHLKELVDIPDKFTSSFFSSELVRHGDIKGELPREVADLFADLTDARFEWLSGRILPCD
jgi:hypothetical protein